MLSSSGWLMVFSLVWLLLALMNGPLHSSDAMPMSVLSEEVVQYTPHDHLSELFNYSPVVITPATATDRLYSAFAAWLPRDPRARQLVELLIDTVMSPDLLLAARERYYSGDSTEEGAYEGHLYQCHSPQESLSILTENAVIHLASLFNVEMENAFILGFMDRVHRADSRFPERESAFLPQQFLVHAVKHHYPKWIPFLSEMVRDVDLDEPFLHQGQRLTALELLILNKDRTSQEKRQRLIKELVSSGADVSDPRLLDAAVENRLYQAIRLLIEHDAPLEDQLVRDLFRDGIPSHIQAALLVLVLQKGYDADKSQLIEHFLYRQQFQLATLLVDCGFDNPHDNTMDLATAGPRRAHYQRLVHTFQLPVHLSSIIHAIMNGSGKVLDVLFSYFPKAAANGQYLLFAIAIEQPVSASVWLRHHISLTYHQDLATVRPSLSLLTQATRRLSSPAVTFATLIRSMIKYKVHEKEARFFARVLLECFHASQSDQLPILAAMASEGVSPYDHLDPSEGILVEMAEKAVRASDTLCFHHLIAKLPSGAYPPFVQQMDLFRRLCLAALDTEQPSLLLTLAKAHLASAKTNAAVQRHVPSPPLVESVERLSLPSSPAATSEAGPTDQPERQGGVKLE